MKLYKSAPRKTKAQAMVEFAIVLPLLLLLLYGLLEAGRLLFIYSTIVTASRQAVRYGSATGQGIGVVVPRYQDCNGIRAAAQRVDFLNAFDDSDIQIFHDDGPDPANPSGPGLNETSFCAGPTDTWAPTNNNTRLVVKIAGDYLPIVPKIIPFVERSSARSNPIQANSARTILLSVAIVVTVPPSTFLAETSTFTPTVATPTFTATLTPTDTPTNTPVFTDTPTITPSPTLSPTVTLSPTITLTPTITPTRVTSGCNLLNEGAGTITLSGNTMTMTIPNPNVYPVTIQNIFVIWNSDKGHQTGNTKELILQSASLLGSPTPFWTADPLNPSVGPSASITPPAAVVFPAGTTSTIVFTFDQTYEKFSRTEEIYINLLTPGCEGFPIDKKYQ